MIHITFGAQTAYNVQLLACRALLFIFIGFQCSFFFGIFQHTNIAIFATARKQLLGTLWLWGRAWKCKKVYTIHENWISFFSVRFGSYSECSRTQYLSIFSFFAHCFLLSISLSLHLSHSLFVSLVEFISFIRSLPSIKLRARKWKCSRLLFAKMKLIRQGKMGETHAYRLLSTSSLQVNIVTNVPFFRLHVANTYFVFVFFVGDKKEKNVTESVCIHKMQSKESFHESLKFTMALNKKCENVWWMSIYFQMTNRIELFKTKYTLPLPSSSSSSNTDEGNEETTMYLIECRALCVFSCCYLQLLSMTLPISNI